MNIQPAIKNFIYLHLLIKILYYDNYICKAKDPLHYANCKFNTVLKTKSVNAVIIQ